MWPNYIKLLGSILILLLSVFFLKTDYGGNDFLRIVFITMAIIGFIEIVYFVRQISIKYKKK